MRNKLHEDVLRGALLALSIFFILILMVGCGKAEKTDTHQTETTTGETIPAEAVFREGKYYIPRKNLQTILLMGLDKFEYSQSSLAYTNKMQSDFLMLLVIDNDAKTIQGLHLNRDTMTQIRRIGFGGSEAGTFVGQLALAHTFGSGGSDSCLNAVRAVSNLLDGVAVDHYLTLTMDAVSVINDAVGGVGLTLKEDMTALNPMWEEGAEITLLGEDSLKFVRARMQVGDGLNASRMKRQEQYLNAFYEKLMEKNREDDDFLGKVLLKVNDDFQSDLTVTQLDKLGQLLAECELEPFQSIAGKTVEGEEFYEFHVDEEDLQRTVLSLFYKEM